MTARVQIQIEAQDAASGVLRAISSQFGALGSVVSDMSDAFGKSNEALNIFQRGMTTGADVTKELAAAEDAANAATARLAETIALLAIDFMKDAITETAKYAEEVNALTLASGASYEQASRLLQVLGDYNITAQDVTVATRKMTQNGFAPTVETIAQLSDQYNSLNTAQEKNNFLIENFGRGGSEWAKVLALGSDTIIELNAGISENLIITKEAYENAERYRLAVDELEDAWIGLKTSVGLATFEPLADLFSVISRNIDESTRSTKDFLSNGIPLVGLFRSLSNAVEVLNEKQNETDLDAYAERWQGLADTFEEVVPSIEDAAAATAEITEKNKEFLSMLGSTQNILESYEEKNKRLAQERAKIEEEKRNLISKGYTEQSTKVQELNGKLEENKKKSAEVAAQFDLDNKKIMLGYLERKLMQDGTLDDAELNWLLEQGQAWGVYSEEAVTAMQTAMASVDQLIAKYNAIPAYVNTTVNTNYSTTGNPPPTYGGGQRYAAGGEVYAGNPVTVGENGAEVFVPSQNGRILGQAESLHAMGMGGGANYFYGNITLQIGEDAAGGILEYR